MKSLNRISGELNKPSYHYVEYYLHVVAEARSRGAPVSNDFKDKVNFL